MSHASGLLCNLTAPLELASSHVSFPVSTRYARSLSVVVQSMVYRGVMEELLDAASPNDDMCAAIGASANGSSKITPLQFSGALLMALLLFAIGLLVHLWSMLRSRLGLKGSPTLVTAAHGKIRHAVGRTAAAAAPASSFA